MPLFPLVVLALLILAIQSGQAVFIWAVISAALVGTVAWVLKRVYPARSESDHKLVPFRGKRCVQCGSEVYFLLPGKDFESKQREMKESSKILREKESLCPGIYCPSGCFEMFLDDGSGSETSESGKESKEEPETVANAGEKLSHPPTA